MTIPRWSSGRIDDQLHGRHVGRFVAIDGLIRKRVDPGLEIVVGLINEGAVRVQLQGAASRGRSTSRAERSSVV